MVSYRKHGTYNHDDRTTGVESTMNETVWFKEPIEHSGSETDRLVVDDVDEREDEYELRTPEGETLTVRKGNVDRIE